MIRCIAAVCRHICRARRDFVRGDVRDLEALRAAVTEADVVYHFRRRRRGWPVDV